MRGLPLRPVNVLTPVVLHPGGLVVAFLVATFIVTVVLVDFK